MTRGSSNSHFYLFCKITLNHGHWTNENGISRFNLIYFLKTIGLKVHRILFYIYVPTLDCDNFKNRCLLGTPETSLRGLSTRKVLSVFKLILSSDPAGRIIGRNLKKCKYLVFQYYVHMRACIRSFLSSKGDRFKVR